jgi:prepilin-type N-terminal cleavage/methylation domain-containing protein/prepilin-type processing-associated H-X9-DG protein
MRKVEGNLIRHDSPTPRVRGFTLLELLVVIGITGLLMGVLLPSLSRSRQVAHRAACLSGLRQIGVAFTAYSMENDGSLPYGPQAPPPSATNFYPLTGNVTSLISLESGAPVGLGLLLSQHLAGNKESLFCPGADDRWDIKSSLAGVGVKQVESSYYYRHASLASLSGPVPRPRVELDRLGTNRKGAAVRCLVMDTQFVAPATPAMEAFRLYTRTHHRRKVVNALFADGHAGEFHNHADRFTVNVSTTVYRTLERILDIFETLDKE